MGASAKYKTITLKGTIDDVNNLPESTLGERVKKIRLSNNYTIKDLAENCNISPETISNIEHGRTTPNISTVSILSQALGTSNKYLLGAENWPEDTPAEIIYKYRMIAGLSQRQLAKKCGLHDSTIQDYENDKLNKKTTIQVIYESIGYKKPYI